MLTGKEIIERGIVIGPLEKDNEQQHSVDLNVIGISKLLGGGYIPVEGKTQMGETKYIDPDMIDGNKNMGWKLEPGSYDLKFAQGCKVPNDKRLRIVHRSSLLRNGGKICSSLYDAGFETDHMGTVVIISVPISIECGARIATAYTEESNVVENLYNGQWQKDQQRK